MPSNTKHSELKKEKKHAEGDTSTTTIQIIIVSFCKNT